MVYPVSAPLPGTHRAPVVGQMARQFSRQAPGTAEYGLVGHPSILQPFRLSPEVYQPDRYVPGQAAGMQRVARYLPTQVFPGQPVSKVAWRNPLKSLFRNREAIIYALHLRTYAATDKNGDGKIDPLLGENGNFLRAIPMLPKLKGWGVNTIHLLPINPIGRIDRLGELGSPGSAYSPLAFDKINPEYDEPGNGLNVFQEARLFVQACHRLGISVMVDIPSCASVDLAQQRPDLILRDVSGNPVIPTNWIDIRMFVPDSPALREFFQKYFDLMDWLGVDGFRVDIARARTPGFWRHFTGKYPDKAWLAESYTEEDESPLSGLWRDSPKKLLKAGFDAYYGQFHIFHTMDAHQYLAYLLQNQLMFKALGDPGKAILGSFLTHDDPSAMTHGGALYCKLICFLMMVQPHTLPYILNGLETGYPHHFNIFDWRPHPTGRYPDIGAFLHQLARIRKSRVFGPVLTQGNFIPLRTFQQDGQNLKVIAFMRQWGDKTLLAVANMDVNANHQATIEVPGLDPNQPLVNLIPNYGEPSTFIVNSTGTIQVDIARGRTYLFELDVPPYTGPIAL